MRYLQLFRISHWLKNLLVFAPIGVLGSTISVPIVLHTLFAFLAFCLLSSAVYIMNDLRDLENDRLNERKKYTPLVSGAVSLRAAGVCLSALLALAAALLPLWFTFYSVGLDAGKKAYIVLVLALYAVLNCGYSFGLKNIPIVDVSIIAAGFALRFLMGVIAAGGVNSQWFYLVIITVSFYMSFGKRRNDLLNKQKERAAALYPVEFLDRNMYVCQALCVVFYTLWCIDPVTVARFGGYALLITVPLVLLILFKYSFDIEKNSGGDPTAVLVGDKALITLCMAYIAVVGVIVYGTKRIIGE